MIQFFSAGSFTKQPLPILKPISKTPSPVKTSLNKSFEALKPKAKKQEEIFSDAKLDESDGDTSVLSDGQTTEMDDSDGFNV